jgi:hypothetical protein
VEQLLSRTGGLLNRLIGGPQQLGLGALMYGSSEIQKPLKSMFGLPSTGDYLRQWEAQSGAPAQRPPMPGLPAGYKEKELAAGAAAERFRPGAGFPGQQSAADRDYESQKRRAEQLAQQDQLSKKYRVAELTKAYNTAATPEEKEKIGLEIWATTNPQLAQELKPGQLGYEQVQSVQAAQSPFGGALQAARNIELADKTSFNAVPSAGFGVGFGANLNTQIPGIQVPANLQENMAGAFTSPVNVPSFDQTAKLFDPAKISEVDRATLIRLFNEGLQKK